METVYVSNRQTIHVSCNGARIGSIQERRNSQAGLTWLPVAGESLTGELPSLDDKRFPSPYVQESLAWIEQRSSCRILPEGDEDEDESSSVCEHGRDDYCRPCLSRSAADERYLGL